MRGYSVATAALALGVQYKWLDNLLSQNKVKGVSQSRQGVQRRLAPAALYIIATIHRLNRGLQIPVASALALAHELWLAPAAGASDDAATVSFEGISLTVDRAELRALVDDAVVGALEIAPRTKRGRPRLRRA
jgi:hypothetical protein